MTTFFHEQLHRSPGAMARLRTVSVTICGAGAIGANAAETLARSGIGKLRIIDYDRVEARNLSTQPFEAAEVGAFKARQVAHALYHSVEAEVEAVTKRLDENNAAKLIGTPDLVLDGFDNSVSRAAVKTHCRQADLPCLHAGLADGYGEIIWNDRYRVPSPAHDDVCDYPLARTLVLLTVAVACEVAIRFLLTGEQPSYTITLEDFAVRPLA